MRESDDLACSTRGYTAQLHRQDVLRAGTAGGPSADAGVDLRRGDRAGPRGLEPDTVHDGVLFDEATPQMVLELKKLVQTHPACMSTAHEVLGLTHAACTLAGLALSGRVAMARMLFAMCRRGGS